MKSENINHEFLDPVLKGETVDHYHHLGISSDDEIVAQMSDLRAVIMGGSGPRMDEFARQWSEEHDGAEIIAFPRRSASPPATQQACCSSPTAWACPVRRSQCRN